MTHSLSVLKYPGAPLLTLPCLGFHGDGDHPETCYDLLAPFPVIPAQWSTPLCDPPLTFG